jgi:hypothetical protein
MKTVNYTKRGQVIKAVPKKHVLAGFSLAQSQLLMIAGVLGTIAYCVGHM